MALKPDTISRCVSESGKQKKAEVEWFVRVSEVPHTKLKLLGREPHRQEIFYYQGRSCDDEVDAESILRPVKVKWGRGLNNHLFLNEQLKTPQPTKHTSHKRWTWYATHCLLYTGACSCIYLCHIIINKYLNSYMWLLKHQTATSLVLFKHSDWKRWQERLLLGFKLTLTPEFYFSAWFPAFM